MHIYNLSWYLVFNSFSCLECGCLCIYSAWDLLSFGGMWFYACCWESQEFGCHPIQSFFSSRDSKVFNITSRGKNGGWLERWLGWKSACCTGVTIDPWIEYWSQHSNDTLVGALYVCVAGAGEAVTGTPWIEGVSSSSCEEPCFQAWGEEWPRKILKLPSGFHMFTSASNSTPSPLIHTVTHRNTWAPVHAKQAVLQWELYWPVSQFMDTFFLLAMYNVFKSLPTEILILYVLFLLVLFNRIFIIGWNPHFNNQSIVSNKPKVIILKSLFLISS